MPAPHADPTRSPIRMRGGALRRAIAPGAAALALALVLAPAAGAGAASAAGTGGPVAATAKKRARKPHKPVKCRRGTVLKHGRCVRKHSAAY
jgi:hypothetical protein